MKKPDRFDKMIARITGPAWCPDPEIPKGEVVVLLRRQHAAYVRLVKGRRPVTKDKNPLTPYGEAYQMLCDDLLAEFERYRKGKP